MAGVSGSARRYAEAAFQIATRDGAVEEWRVGLHELGALLRDEAAAAFMRNPSVPAETRLDALTRAMPSRPPRPLLNLTLLLLQRRRIDRLPQVADEYQRLVDRSEGIVRAVVTSAKPLSVEDVDRVRRRLSGLTGGRVELTTEVDAALLGGLVVRFGDRLIDGSVRGRLERLRTELVSGAL
jgi:F-type H+-transporting ATPase subunit delta